MASEIEGVSLPEPVRRYVQRAIPAGPGAAQSVRVTQTGEMILKPGARPRPFTAFEDLATRHVSFTWTARFAMLGPLGLRVTDRYDGRDGTLEVRALGIPLQRRHGPNLAQGEICRYLAEIAWVPHAILTNRQLEWRQLDERTVEVATHSAEKRVAVQVIFNEAGEITQTVAERPRAEAGNELTTWVGVYGTGLPRSW
ncbi:MAG TPA: DUF6544 family protein [Solirubrobacteraceae bacterium]|jgi:hypothetical protein